MEATVATRPAATLLFEEETGLLAPDDKPYLLSLEEVYRHFVKEAPFAEQRELIFDLFVVYLKQTRGIIPERRVWVDGSFVSMRSDRPPSDIDVALLVPSPSNKHRRHLVSNGLLTMSDVQVKMADTKMPEISKLAPYGGLVDAYLVDAASAAQVRHWEFLWSTPKGPDGELDFDRSKGFLEVIEDD